MRMIITILSILIGINSVFALTKDQLPVNDNQLLAYQIAEQIDEKFTQYSNLRMAKKSMLAGDTIRARYYLNRIDRGKIKLEAVRRYYLSLIEFVEGNYQRSLDLITGDRFYGSNIYVNVCMLKIMNMLALPPNKDELNKEFSYCSFKTLEMSKTDNIWLQNLVAFKNVNKKALRGDILKRFTFILNDVDTIRVWLKTGIFLNKEESLLKLLSNIPQRFYNYGTIRELIGLVHYRLGNYDLAQSFIEDLSSSNAENIRGNIKLKNEEYELAFGHFKLALKEKANSFNALERVLALSWILEQWQDGLVSVENLTSKLIDPDKRAIMRTAFLLNQNKFELADKNISLLEKKFPTEKPFELQLIRGYYGLRTGHSNRFFDGKEDACKNFDGLSCWWLMKSFDYRFLDKTLKREDNIAEQIDLDLDKLKNSRFMTPLNEINYIHQDDIEEMDGLTIKISNN